MKNVWVILCLAEQTQKPLGYEIFNPIKRFHVDVDLILGQACARLEK
jgi:hypothetical protein